MRWTKEMKRTLREMAECENFSYTDIAKILTIEYGTKFTKNSCVGMAARIGIPRRPPVIQKPAVKLEKFTIYDLEWGMCKWPLGKPYDKPPFTYCGRKTDDNGSWCLVHYRKVFTARRT